MSLWSPATGLRAGGRVCVALCKRPNVNPMRTLFLRCVGPPPARPSVASCKASLVSERPRGSPDLLAEGSAGPAPLDGAAAPTYNPCSFQSPLLGAELGPGRGPPTHDPTRPNVRSRRIWGVGWAPPGEAPPLGARWPGGGWWGCSGVLSLTVGGLGEGLRGVARPLPPRTRQALLPPGVWEHLRGACS